MSVVISVYSRKGGVGRTSTCMHMAGTLAKIGRRVLLVDNSPQADLTKVFWGAAEARRVGPDDGVASLYDADANPQPGRVIRGTHIQGISLIPATTSLERHDFPEPGSVPETGLRDFLSEVSGDYDITLIDNPRDLRACTRAGLIASDYALIPIVPDGIAVMQIEPTMQGIAEVRSGPNPKLAVLGILLTIYDRRLSLYATHEALLREHYGELVFRNAIPSLVGFEEADLFRQPISSYKPNSAAALATAAVVEEFLGRLAATKPNSMVA